MLTMFKPNTSPATQPNIEKYKSIFISNDFEPDDVWAIVSLVKKLANINHHPEITFCENAGKFPEYKVITLRKKLYEGYLANCFTPNQSIKIIEGSQHPKWCEIIFPEFRDSKPTAKKPTYSSEAFRSIVTFLYNPENEPRLYVGISVFIDLDLAVKFLQDPANIINETKKHAELSDLVRTMQELQKQIDFSKCRDANGNFKLNIDFAGTGSENFRETVSLSKAPIGELGGVKRDEFFEKILASFNAAFYYESYHSAKGMGSTNDAWPTFGKNLVSMLQKKDLDPEFKPMLEFILSYAAEWNKIVAEDCLNDMKADLQGKTQELLDQLKTYVFGENRQKGVRDEKLEAILESKASLQKRIEQDMGKTASELKQIDSFKYNLTPLVSILSSHPQFCLADMLFMLALLYPENAGSCLKNTKVTFPADSKNLNTQVKLVTANEKSNLWYWMLDEKVIQQLGDKFFELIASPSKKLQASVGSVHTAMSMSLAKS